MCFKDGDVINSFDLNRTDNELSTHHYSSIYHFLTSLASRYLRSISVCIYVCMHAQHFQQCTDQPGLVANPACCSQLNRKRMFFSLSPFAPENSVSPDKLGRAAPHQPDPLILHTQGESVNIIVLILTRRISPTLRDGIHILHRQPPSGQSQVPRATQMLYRCSLKTV